MLLLRKRHVHAFSALFLVLYVSAQSSPGNSFCGSDITYYGLYFTIKFNSYCNTRLSSTNLVLPVKKSSFKDCATACVWKGKSCGGFAFDRDSHFSENNCYLNTPSADFQKGTSSDNIYFDSAVIDNSSLPIVRTDCTSIGQNGVYEGYNLHCGTAIPIDSDPSQISTVFASSLSDCIVHCKNHTQVDGSPLCYAVTWDPTTLHGYENCYLKNSNFVAPTVNTLWDSATVMGTSGHGSTSTNTSTGTKTGSTTSASSSPSLSFSYPSSSGSPQTQTVVLTTPRTVAIAICSTLGLLSSLASLFWFFRRRRNIREVQQVEAAVAAQADSEGPTHWRRELSGRGLVEKADDGPAVRVHEMDGEARSPRSELHATQWSGTKGS